MEKNEFLLLNEIIYHIHTAETLEELRLDTLSQIKFIIPYTYASLITVHIDPATKNIEHSDPVCMPESFYEVEAHWIQQAHQDRGLWLSHAPECVVIRDSEMWDDEARLNSPIYQNVYWSYNIYDVLQMNVAYQNQVMALLSLYRTRLDGLFTDQDAFYLRSLSNHINYAYYQKSQQPAQTSVQARSLEQLAQEFHLTKREQEILSLILQGRDNEEILQLLTISKHTLFKHLQNIYRKCNVSSRWELLKLKGP